MSRHYRGNYWAIVAGPKDKDIIPLPLVTYVRTANKDEMIRLCKERVEPGITVRAIPQPYDGQFEAGM